MIRFIKADAKVEVGVGTTVAMYERYEGYGRHACYAVYEEGGLFLTVNWNGYHDEYDSRPDGWSECKLDATPGLAMAYEAHLFEKRQAEMRRAKQMEAERRAAAVARGAEVMVVRGRKVAQGTRGVCIWRGESRFGERVGLKAASGEVFWTALTNVEVTPECFAERLRSMGAEVPEGGVR